MKSVENKIERILKQNNIPEKVVETIRHNLCDNGLYMFCQLIESLAGDEYEEEVWDILLKEIPSESIPDELINYLWSNKISLMTLCHLNLSDKWLMKLAEYDEAPIYKLADRFYNNQCYTQIEFVNFYKRYLRHNDDILIHLLELYQESSKRRLLLFLCSSNEEFKDKQLLEWHIVADQVATMVDGDIISDISKRYANAGIVMNAIAKNHFTPEEILSTLSTTKGIRYASEIREKSKETLKIKRAKNEL